jgi:hypothetical protein
MRIGFLVLMAVLAMLGTDSVRVRSAAGPFTIYDSNPEHIWNRVYRLFFVRYSADGQVFGGDILDPLLWYETESFFRNPLYQQSLALLDEFLATDAERLITDPLKRALFQHDLWQVFDWLTLRAASYPAEREALQERIARIMRRVALSESQVAALPNNYELAVAAHTYATQFTPNQRFAPFFLPPELGQAGSAWINVGVENSIAAYTHVVSFQGHSAFYVYYHVPAGREATLDFITALRESNLLARSHRGSVPPPPTLPEGTQVALVRQMLAIDMTGRIVAAPITESVQIRVLPPSQPMAVSQFNLSRQRLFSGQSGGLYGAAPDDQEFPTFFMSHGIDPFDSELIAPEQAKAVTLQQCQHCHFGNEADNIISARRFAFPLPSSTLPLLTPTDVQAEAARIIAWKQSQDNWKMLHQFWAAG